MNILCLGDVVGKPGRLALEKVLPELQEEHQIDLIVVNAENAAGGTGLTSRMANHFFRMGCDVVTLGDHVWDQKELEGFLNTAEHVVRPANFPPDTPGQGITIAETKNGKKIAVICLLGRVFMKYFVSCPFRAFDEIYQNIAHKVDAIIIDFHAEATSEKVAFGHYVDGRVSGVFGTHTHIQTADNTILPQGTGYITDIGMVGPYDSVIGQKKELIIQRFLTCRPVKFQVATDNVKVCGAVFQIDDATGKTKSVVRIQKDVELADQ